MYYQYPYHHYYREQKPIQRKVTLLNKDYEESWNTFCHKSEQGQTICRPNPLYGIPYQPKEHCHQEPPVMKRYNCIKKRRSHILVELNIRFDNQYVSEFQKPEIYNCVLNQTIINEAARAFEQQIGKGAKLTGDLTQRAAQAAKQKFFDLYSANPCPASFEIQINVSSNTTALQDWYVDKLLGEGTIVVG